MARYNDRLRRIEQHLPPDPEEWLQWINQRAIERGPIAAAVLTEMAYICELTPEGSDFRAPPGTIIPTEEEYLEAHKLLHKTKGI